MRRPPYTQVAHELIDVHMRDMGECELKAMLYLLRATLGWQRKEATVSLSMISESTGMDKGALCRSMKVLEAKGFVASTKNYSDDGGCSATTYTVIFEDDPLLEGDSPLSGEQDPSLPGGNSIRSKENNSKENNLAEPPEPPPTGTDAHTFRRLWEKRIGRTKPSDRKLITERWGFEQPMSEDDVDAALVRFRTWLHAAPKVNANPLVIFLKNPSAWLRSESASESEAPQRPVESSPPPAIAPAGSNEQVLERDFQGEWNAVVTKAPPVLVWDQRDNPLLREAAGSAEFVQNFAKILSACQALMEKGLPEKTACLNFTYMLRNWRKILNGGCNWMWADFNKSAKKPKSDLDKSIEDLEAYARKKKSEKAAREAGRV